jgi:hypothetical protein
MTTYAFPTLSRSKPNEFSFGQRSNTVVHTSPLSGQVQTVELPGARWFFSARYRAVQEADRALLDAWFAQLRGQANRFTAWDFSKPYPRGTMRGTPVTSGSTAAGATSVTINATAGQASTTVLAGDKLSFGGELKIITATATLNGSGVATLSVEPPFRGTIGNGASVVWDRPTALFLPTASEWSAQFAPGNLADFAIDAVEVFA